MMELFIKLVLSIITFGAATVLNFAMFKIPIKGNDKQIALLALVIGFISFYTHFVIESPHYFLYQIIGFVIMLMILRRYPIVYSLIVTATGFLATSLIDSAATLLVIQTKMATLDEIIKSLKDYTILHIIVTVIYCAIALLLSKYKIGFSFVVRRFSGLHRISAANYVWAVLLITFMLVLTLFTQPAIVNSLKMYMLLLVVVIFVISICYAFKQNKKVVADRFDLKG